MADQENHDVFADDASATEAAETDAPAQTGAEDKGGKAEEAEGKPAAEEAEGTEGTEKQEGEEAAPPAAEGKEAAKSDKMIPESRLKAAVKDVNKQLLEARQELATLKAQPAPDRNKDPKGYDQHVRVETSKAIMMQRVPDYADKISHFQEMAKANPALNEIVRNAEAPAALAYDLAQKDLEIKELMGLKDSDDWKQFQAWKASGGAEAKPADVAQQLSAEKPADRAAKIPNLNRNATASNPNGKSKDDGSDDLFADHYSVAS